MSRSWERKVRKNSAKLNKQRQKSGKPSLHVGEENHDIFKGRNIILPLILIVIALLFAYIGSLSVQEGNQSVALYWVTIAAYIGLGLIIFFRKPYLKVTKDSLVTTKWNRVRVLQAKDIKRITITSGYVVIEKSGKGSNWMFSRFLNRYDTAAMGERLVKFAQQHQIPHE